MPFSGGIGRCIALCVLGAVVAIGCSDDDKQSDGGSASEGTWTCYGTSTPRECRCVLLEPGNVWEVGGAAKVDACGFYDICYGYEDTAFGAPGCSCGDLGFTPTDAANVEEVAVCPSETLNRP